MAVPPSSLMIAAVSSIVSGCPYGERSPGTLRPVQYTIAPASPRARAIPRPAPRVAPATSAMRPERDCSVDMAEIEHTSGNAPAARSDPGVHRRLLAIQLGVVRREVSQPRGAADQI